jgi:GT2 family glycosyltransferase
MLSEGLSWSYRPRVSILLPVFDPARSWLEDAIASVLRQVYGEWELCIADDASTRPYVHDVLQRFAAADTRIKVATHSTNGGIVATSNTALGLATGDYVALLDHDDVLRPHALHAMVEFLQAHRRADVLYSDEDKLLPSGDLGEPFFKPGWSPELLLSWNYLSHLVLLRKELVDSVGGFRVGFDGSQDHDLLLRVTERTDAVEHVAEMVYAWRSVPGSSAERPGAKEYAAAAGRRAVADALERRGTPAAVSEGSQPFFYDVRYAIKGAPAVAIVIPTRDRGDLLEQCLQSVEAESTYSNYSIIIIDNGSRHADTLRFLARCGHEVVRMDEPFNYSKLVNAGALAASGAEHLLLLNNDMTVMKRDWIEALIEHSQQAHVGAVGARLLFPNGDVQHEGIICGRGRLAGNVHMGWPVVRETSAVTGACMMTRRSVFAEVGGFDEQLRVGFNDVDYCLRIRARGYRVLFTPHAELRHHESASRGRLNPVTDQRRFIARWGDPELIEDPYLNPHLSWPNPLEFRD